MTTLTVKIPQAALDDLDAARRADEVPSRSDEIRARLNEDHEQER